MKVTTIPKCMLTDYSKEALRNLICNKNSKVYFPVANVLEYCPATFSLLNNEGSRNTKGKPYFKTLLLFHVVYEISVRYTA